MKKHYNTLKTGKTAIALVLSASLLLTACGNMQERLANVGKPPAMSNIQNVYNKKDYQPVSLPMPPVEAQNTNANSLWQSSRQTFFKDQRAHKVGDILTVMIDIKDEADMENSTERTRTGSEGAGLPNFLGLEGSLSEKVLPDALDLDNLVNMSTNSASAGDGKIEREETIKLKIAAMITQVLPNGNFVIRGQQEVRVNFELRELTIDGVIRPEDVLNNNSITHDKIAEARISYGGRGHVTDMQQPRYGQQVIDAVMPF
jgi:flagellar L-ring protein precursor FlgH